MSITTELTPTGAWQPIATEGEVTFTPEGDCRWATTQSTSPPTFESGGQAAPPGQATSLTLIAAERLWLKATRKVYVNADAPVSP